MKRNISEKSKNVRCVAFEIHLSQSMIDVGEEKSFVLIVIKDIGPEHITNLENVLNVETTTKKIDENYGKIREMRDLHKEN